MPVEQARAQILAVAAGLDREYAGQRRERAPWVSRVTEIDRRLLVGEAGLIAGAAGMATLLVLLVGCANVANLVLARTSARSREIAVRLSLGAGRGRILRQFLTESLFLSLLGTGLGVAIASGGLRALTRASGAQPLAWSLAPDFRVVIYALTLSALVALVTGVVPALQASRPAVLPALKAGAGPHHLGRWRAVFVGAEIAICLVFLVTTALLLRAAQHAKAIDPIIPVHHLLAVSAEDSRLHGYAGPKLAGLLREMQARAEALPGIAATAVVNPVPFSGNRHGTTVRPFEAADAPGTRVFLSNVSPGFFEVVNLRIVRGGGFSGAPDEVVINQALALRLFNGSDPLGRRITSGDFDKRQHTVVGVVQDAPFVSLRSRDDPFMFRPIDPEGGGSVVVRTSGPATGLARPLAEALQRVDQSFDIDVNPIARGIEDEIAAVGNGVTVVAGLSSLALLLALFGVAAVTVHSVVQRTHEIGVRMALGAQPVDAIRLVVRQSLRPVLAGAAIGLMGAGTLGRLLPVESLYGLSRLDPIAFGAAGFFLVATSIAAAWLPARRVAKIDPLLSLRAD